MKDSETNTEMKDLLVERSSTYSLLARLYREEVRDALLPLKQVVFPESTASDEANEGAALMNAYLARADAASETELSVDFAQLFILREQHTRDAAYPFESVYTSSTHVVMDDARDDVLARYRENGFQKKKECKLAEDHIALELEFESMLSESALEAHQERDGERLTSILAIQRSFLEDHLLDWVEPFAEAMGRHARTDFYHGLALFTKGFLELDHAFLEGLQSGERG